MSYTVKIEQKSSNKIVTQFGIGVSRVTKEEAVAVLELLNADERAIEMLRNHDGPP